MIGWFEAFILGLAQGITEYLPVSSSGHLVIFQHLFGITEPTLFFDIVLHVGTLIAVIWYYRSELVTSISEALTGLNSIRTDSTVSDTFRQNEGFRLWVLIVIGTIPTGLIGVLFEDSFEALFGAPKWVGIMLLVTGSILLMTRFAGDGDKEIPQLKVWHAIAIGVIQGLAITPGISRSGSTIAAALFMGIERETAARFSFLLSIPSIMGALILKIGSAENGFDMSALAIGFVTAMVTGYICLAFLVAIVKKGGLSWFSWYCFLAGIVTIFYIA